MSRKPILISLALVIGLLCAGVLVCLRFYGSQPPQTALEPPSIPVHDHSVEPARARPEVPPDSSYGNLEFHGRVVDQAGAPVPNVTATFNWFSLDRDTGAPLKVRFATSTDNEGLLQLTNAWGRALFLQLAKAGYYDHFAPFNLRLSSSPAYYAPDPEHPLLITLYKKGSAEVLLRVFSKNKFRLDAGPQYLDLVNNRVTSTTPADLCVDIQSPGTNSSGRFGWSAILTVPEGGILESKASRMLRAPQDGYVSQLTYGYEEEADDWMPMKEIRAYIRSRDGAVFGSITVIIVPRLGTHPGMGSIQVFGFLNTNSSPNLEYSTATQLGVDQL